MSIAQPKFKVRKTKLGSYPYISVVLSITLALFVIGVFGLLIIYSKELERVILENVKIQVYLKSHITEEQRKEIEKSLSTRYFLPKNLPPGKADKRGKSIQFISKEEAAKQFIKETGEDFQKFLGENPLRDAFLVSINPIYHDKRSMAKIKSEVEKIPGIFQVYYVENIIDSINENVTKIGVLLVGLSILLLITVVLLIYNTLRLALFSQRFLIRSMQLVGAKRWFIQRPFLMRASVHGFLAGLLASGMLIAVLSYANKRIEDLSLIQNTHRIGLLLGVLSLLGVVVAFASTFRAVRKYLRLSLDELY
ncbi:MAG: permease-like cell division protein FtsX [Bacteroidota bacterium]